MPYISEELWQRLPFPDGKLPAESICISEFPKDYKFECDQSIIEEFETINLILGEVWQLRSGFGVPAKDWPTLFI